MAGVNWKVILKAVSLLLVPIMRLVSKQFKDELEKFIEKKYKEALETENPWDDFLFETLAFWFGIDL